MSKEILIAGSGFMGTSMAHALGNCNITCFETNEAYLVTLKNLNIYKNIFSDVSDIKGEFDLIIDLQTKFRNSLILKRIPHNFFYFYFVCYLLILAYLFVFLLELIL